MVQATSSDFGPPIADTKAPMDKRIVGMLVFIGSEAIFFMLLVLAYVYFRSAGIYGPTAKNLDVGTTAIFSVCLFASSFTVWQAERNLKKRNRWWAVGWLIATIVLGAIFLYGEVHEYLGLIDKDITISRNTFGTSYYVLTGFHGIHVLTGLIMLTTIAVFTAFGEYKDGKTTPLTLISYYWHFVDSVWVVIFAIVYIGSLLT